MTIFISNLPYRVTEAQLADCLGQFGEIANVRIGRDRQTSASRGFAFVEMLNDRDALTAIGWLDGKDWDGRRLNVELSRERASQ
jgi:RNA recognition motif-containing protein